RLQGKVEVVREYERAWREALQHVEGMVVVNCTACCDIKCIVSASLVPLRKSECENVVIVRCGVERSWDDVSHGKAAFQVLQVPFIAGIDMSAVRAKDVTCLGWWEWLQSAVNLAKFLEHQMVEQVLGDTYFELPERM